MPINAKTAKPIHTDRFPNILTNVQYQIGGIERIDRFSELGSIKLKMVPGLQSLCQDSKTKDKNDNSYQ